MHLLLSRPGSGFATEPAGLDQFSGQFLVGIIGVTDRDLIVIGSVLGARNTRRPSTRCVSHGPVLWSIPAPVIL